MLYFHETYLFYSTINYDLSKNAKDINASIINNVFYTKLLQHIQKKAQEEGLDVQFNIFGYGG